MYRAELLRKYQYGGNLEGLFDEARYCFVHRKFSEALELMNEAEKICPRKYMSSVFLNKALFHHLLGHKDEARQLYASLNDTTAKMINYMAFCHRYFMYSDFHGISVPDSDSLAQIYLHNEMNFTLAVNIYSERERRQRRRSSNIFEERVLNDYYFKAGLPQEHIFSDKLSAEIAEISSDIPYKILPPIKNRIGIYVNDIQRHKEAAYIYDLTEILQGLGYSVYVYFDNIFTNKLTTLLPEGITFRSTVNRGILGFNNITVKDRISALIDMSGNKLRTRITALAENRSKLITFDEIFGETPFCLRTGIYFGGQYAGHDKHDFVAVIGDMRYIYDEEFSRIESTYHGRRIIFMSFAFCEEVFRKNFESRLARSGMDISLCKIIPGIIPFSEYMKFLASSSAVTITTGAGATELSEALFSGANTELLAHNPVLHRMGTREDFAENLRSHLQNIPAAPAREYSYDDELRVIYRNGEHAAEVNMTCSGDLVIFSELKMNEA